MKTESSSPLHRPLAMLKGSSIFAAQIFPSAFPREKASIRGAETPHSFALGSQARTLSPISYEMSNPRPSLKTCHFGKAISQAHTNKVNFFEEVLGEDERLKNKTNYILNKFYRVEMENIYLILFILEY